METARRGVFYQELLAGWELPSYFKSAISLIEGVTKKVSNAALTGRQWLSVPQSSREGYGIDD